MREVSAKQLEKNLHYSVHMMSQVVAFYEQVINRAKLDPSSFRKKQDESDAEARARLGRFSLMTSRLRIALKIIASTEMTEFTIKKLELLLKFESR